MRRERRPASFLRGLLLFLLGALVGANVVYFLMSRATRSPVSPPSGDRIETPFGIRDIRFDPDHGLFVNGEHVPIRGVTKRAANDDSIDTTSRRSRPSPRDSE